MNKQITVFDKEYILKKSPEGEFVTFISDLEVEIIISESLLKRLKEIQGHLSKLDKNLINKNILLSFDSIAYLSTFSNFYKGRKMKLNFSDISFDEELNTIYCFTCDLSEGYYTWYTKFSHSLIMGVWYEVS